MREYQDTKDRKLRAVVCNQCGRKIPVKNGIVQEGVFGIRYAWGYMSGKDGMQDTFDLCEECYDKLLKGFCIPASREEVTEYL